jgi:RimJ/RimL family protein N-acetyltransferase/catechol 2,3-dioxygenase-like lactoylglutathione lyase family enzyme
MGVRRLDHVQLAMPVGREGDAAAFYDGLLGIPQVPKPPHLAARGGCWFERGDLKIHVGVDADFRPARKAHPALLVDDLAGLVERLRAAGVTIRDDEPLDGYDRAYVDDPFGNRIELLEPVADISFRPLRVIDFDMLVEWFADPVVARWWNQPAELDSVSAKYLPRIDGTGDPTSMWIAEVDGEPAGLLQHYRHTDYSAHDAAVGVPNAVGIDYLLGARHRGRGLGGPILRAFARLALEQQPDAAVCVATPAIDNAASCAVLERAGFVRSHECQPPDEPPAAVYVIDRFS